jgi:hypothetical protein
VEADPIHQALFRDMADRLWEHFFSLLELDSLTTPKFLDYPEKFPGPKRDKYSKQTILQLAGDKIPENWFGDAMVKSGEVYLREVGRQTEFDYTQNRPRMIANPNLRTLGIP